MHNHDQAPIAKQVPHELVAHGDTRVDNYYWLRERENQDVIDYLEAENSYTKSALASTASFQEELFEEIKGRIKEEDESVPYKKNGYWYFSRFEAGAEHRVYLRKKAGLDKTRDQVILDVNELAAAHAYYQVGGLSVSPDNKMLCYGEDTVSRRIYTLRFKRLGNGEVQELEIPGTTGQAVWAADSNTVFYVERDEQTLRAWRVMSVDLETGEQKAHFVENDDTFHVHLRKTKDSRYILIACNSTLTSEYHYLDAKKPEDEFTCFQERIRGMEYHIYSFEDKWIILNNWEAQNFRLHQTLDFQTERASWKELVAHRESTLLEAVAVFDGHFVLSERTDGLSQLRIIQYKTGISDYVDFEAEAYWIGGGDNPEYKTDTFRFRYSSFTTPLSVVDYNIRTGTKTTLKQQEVVGGFNEEEYESERIMAPARDGEHVPITLVWKKGVKKPGPLLLYAYGSYGATIPVYFSGARLSLLDRGFTYAMAHIRGGEDLGRNWYDTGKMLQKKNTFFDFIDCGEHLIKEGYTTAEQLYAKGGSAGGLLMGAVANYRPDLWNGIVAAVPFVDVVTTMLDESIPLTTFEYDEWGNPNEEKYYKYMLSYSPYDNVEAKAYPNMLVTTGLHDSQVQYWEPAKWVAKLRELKTDENLLLLHTDMEAGHGGASGRFKTHKDTAREYAFLLMLQEKAVEKLAAVAVSEEANTQDLEATELETVEMDPSSPTEVQSESEASSQNIQPENERGQE